MLLYKVKDLCNAVLPATGLRASELLSIRIKYLHLDSNPANVLSEENIQRLRTDRHVFLTEVVVTQLNQWLEYKYRTRRICHKDVHTKKEEKQSQSIKPQREMIMIEVFAVIPHI